MKFIMQQKFSSEIKIKMVADAVLYYGKQRMYSHVSRL